MVDDVPLTLDLAAAGVGIAMLAGHYENHPFHSGLYRPMPDHVANIGWLNINSRATRERAIVTEFRQWLAEEFSHDQALAITPLIRSSGR